jgi:hypothetical protein
MPFTYIVTFDEACIVLEPVDITCCMLVNTENDSIVVGGSSCILRFGGGTERGHGPLEPLRATADALADDEDLDQLVPGTYKLVAGVRVFSKLPGGGVHLTELDAELTLTLA